jgi:tRNA (mo5U34)-methyltransferase
MQESQIDAIRWFHHFDKETFGFTTKGAKGIPNRQEVDLWGFEPEMFRGKTVLDIGAWDGYFSFYAEMMGAARVLATDHFCWSGPGWGSKAGFDLAHRLLKSKVRSQEIDVTEISPESVGTHDVVLFLGVCYHLPDPIEGLKRAASVTKDLMIVETTFENLDETKALFEYKPERLRGDSSNHWSPNIKGLCDVLSGICGFKQVNARRWCEDRVICYARKEASY